MLRGWDAANCRLCGRNCGADRESAAGFCGMGTAPRVARAMLHHYEEPCISGKNGAGAVFFSGCSLRCVYCQNARISREGFGKDISVGRLAEIFGELERAGAHNIDLVNPTHFVPQIAEALEQARPGVPVVYNSGGYDGEEAIERMNGLADVYLPDLKYMSREASKAYSGAENYFVTASAAVRRMVEQTGPPVIEDGLIKRGVIVRHLVLPGLWRDSVELVRWLWKEFRDGVMISLMSQYTPMPGVPAELDRRIMTLEYRRVTDVAEELGFCGYTQERGSAKKEYTPDFDLQGV